MPRQNKKNQQSQLQPSNQTPPPPPSPVLVERFLDLQQQELQIRTEELSLQAQQEENNKSIAESSISANLKDRESERSHKERKTKILFMGSTILVIIITLFAGYALYSGQEAIVMKMVEILAVFSAGFVGGYGFKSSRSPSNENINS